MLWGSLKARAHSLIITKAEIDETLIGGWELPHYDLIFDARRKSLIECRAECSITTLSLNGVCADL